MIGDVRGKVAVVTGGARGIGAAMGRRFAESGMKVVLTDVLADQLAETSAELQGEGLEVEGWPSDVTSLDSLVELREATVKRFGDVHLLCNNAGVSSGAQGKTWEHDMNDWHWSFDVNVFGVVHGINAFVPYMLEHNTEGHVVNTSSGNGGLETLPAGCGGNSTHSEPLGFDVQLPRPNGWLRNSERTEFTTRRSVGVGSGSDLTRKSASPSASRATTGQ